MWANAQHDGRPTEYRWRPLFNAAVWLTHTSRVPCSNDAKTRNLLKFAGVLQTNETISASSGPKFTIWWRRYCCLPSFFPIVDTRLSCEDIARESCAIVRIEDDFLHHFCVLYFHRAACSTFQTCILNSLSRSVGHLERK